MTSLFNRKFLWGTSKFQPIYLLLGGIIGGTTGCITFHRNYDSQLCSYKKSHDIGLSKIKQIYIGTGTTIGFFIGAFPGVSIMILSSGILISGINSLNEFIGDKYVEYEIREHLWNSKKQIK